VLYPERLDETRSATAAEKLPAAARDPQGPVQASTRNADE
jgi:hypothetical protein